MIRLLLRLLGDRKMSMFVDFNTESWEKLDSLYGDAFGFSNCETSLCFFPETQRLDSGLS